MGWAAKFELDRQNRQLREIETSLKYQGMLFQELLDYRLKAYEDRRKMAVSPHPWSVLDRHIRKLEKELEVLMEVEKHGFETNDTESETYKFVYGLIRVKTKELTRYLEARKLEHEQKQ